MIYRLLNLSSILAEWSNIDQPQFDRNNFGSDSTIDSQSTVCPIPASSTQNDDDQGKSLSFRKKTRKIKFEAFDAFLAERKQTQDIPTSVTDNGPVYVALNASQ